MGKFVCKFLVALLFLIAPAAWFHFMVEPQITGDLGRLGMIPFGINTYTDDNLKQSPFVVSTTSVDSLKLFPVVVIGDSFSNQGNDSFTYPLSKCLGQRVMNHIDKEYGFHYPLFTYINALNNDAFTPGQIVIIETVERALVDRLSKMDLTGPASRLSPIMIDDSRKVAPSFLSRLFSWLRLSLGINDPVREFTLKKPCFSPKKYKSKLYVFDGEYDSDLDWHDSDDEIYRKACDNISKLIDYSQNKGVNLFILIATDKYDAYEPWIVGKHESNPTLDSFPKHHQIFDARQCLRQAIEDGILDVYKVDDTHWSVIGARIVACALSARLQDSI